VPGRSHRNPRGQTWVCAPGAFIDSYESAF
jgi:hypothetical protein